MAREHDPPNQTLIIEGSRHLQLSKCGLGNDYPITPLEELKQREKGE